MSIFTRGLKNLLYELKISNNTNPPKRFLKKC